MRPTTVRLQAHGRDSRPCVSHVRESRDSRYWAAPCPGGGGGGANQHSVTAVSGAQAVLCSAQGHGSPGPLLDMDARAPGCAKHCPVQETPTTAKPNVSLLRCGCLRRRDTGAQGGAAPP